MDRDVDVGFGSLAAARRMQKAALRAAGKRPSPDGRLALLYVNLLRHFQRIVDFDAQITHGTVEF